MAMSRPERDLEEALVAKLQDIKYEYRPDIRDRAALEVNFRKKFEALNRVALTDAEFHRLMDEIVTSDVFTAARTLRERNSFTRDDGTPLHAVEYVDGRKHGLERRWGEDGTRTVCAWQDGSLLRPCSHF